MKVEFFFSKYVLPNNLGFLKQKRKEGGNLNKECWPPIKRTSAGSNTMNISQKSIIEHQNYHGQEWHQTIMVDPQR